MNTNYNTTQTKLAMSNITAEELLEEVFDDVLVADDGESSRFSAIEMAKKAPAKKKEDDDEEDEDGAEEEGDDDWEKAEEGEEWDKDFEEFDVPKKGGKVGGKNAKEEDEDDLDLDLEEDFDDFDNQDDDNFEDDF